jgi:hypothetical protein
MEIKATNLRISMKIHARPIDGEGWRAARGGSIGNQ